MENIPSAARTTGVLSRGGRMLAIGAAVAAMTGLAACGDDESSSGNSGATNSGGSEVQPVEGRVQPVENAEDKKVRVAMIGFSNNPYWVSVKKGVDHANKVLSSRGGEVKWIVAGANIDVPTVNSAINAAATQGYNGIGFFIAGDGNCPTIKAITAKKISAGAYNTLFPCVEESGGVINYAQEQTEAGKNAAKQLIEAVGDKGGKVGIVVSQFTAPGSEQRRKGFLEGLKGSNITPVSKGVEAKDAAGATYNAAKDYLTSTKDLVGIYATAGGPFGAAQAVKEANKQDAVKVIGYDFTPENIAAIRDGSMYGVTGQDEFGQGYNVAVQLYNHQLNGEKGEPVLQPAISPFMTKENVDQLDPSKQPIGTVPEG